MHRVGKLSGLFLFSFIAVLSSAEATPGELKSQGSYLGVNDNVGYIGGGPSGDADSKAGANPNIVAGAKCTGAGCETNQARPEEEQFEPANLSLTSPFTNVVDSLNSPKLATNISGDWASSYLALTFTNWQQQAQDIGAGLSRAMDISLATSTNRYLAEQNVRNTLKESGEAGEILLKSYQGCVANLVKGGLITYAAAQESCLGGWKKPAFQLSSAGLNILPNPIAATTEQVDPAINKIDFANHPAHPLSPELVSAAGTIGSTTNDPNEIKLTDLLFNRAIAMSGLGNPKTETYKEYRKIFLNIFGDIHYRYAQKNSNIKTGLSPFIGLTGQRKRGTFSYQQAMAESGVPAGSYSQTIFTGTDKDIPVFSQFYRFRVDLTYYALVSILHNYCACKKKPSFWIPGDTQNGGENISYNQIKIVSSNIVPFSSDIGKALFKYLDKEVKGVSLCRLLDPDGPVEFLPVNATKPYMTFSLKATYDTSKYQAGRQVGLMSFLYKYSQDTATAQINEMLKEQATIVAGLSGGSLESQARTNGLTLIRDAAGAEWNYNSAVVSMTNALHSDIVAIDERAQDNYRQ